MNPAAARPLCLLLCALGGEGGGVLADWLVTAARAAGYPVQATSIPGVAQRTGATTYYVEVFPVPLAELGGRRPVLGLAPVPGMVDALVASELLEAARQVGLGMAEAGRTLVLASSARSLTTQERIQLADGRYDGERLESVLRHHSRELHLLDMAAMTRAAGTVVSAVMLGAIAASGLLPFERRHYEDAVRAGGRGAEASLRGFALAHADLAARRAGQTAAAGAAAAAGAPAMGAAAPAAVQGFPSALGPLVALGFERTREFQDGDYADLYLQRLRRVLAAETAADPGAAQGWALTAEAARWLALWMAYDDLVRVAQRKGLAARRRRLRALSGAGAGEVVKVYDVLRPGVAEVAGLLPPRLAAGLRRWDAGRQARGHGSWSVPLSLGAHTVSGAVALRVLASLRWLRLRSDRHHQEQQAIEAWLGGIERLAAHGWAGGMALARCGRLIRGYGSTHQRGAGHLAHLLAAVDRGALAPAQGAAAIAAACQAALADDTGLAFDQALAGHGLPPRAAPERPVRWVR